MSYTLKKGEEAFQVMDGPFAYHTFKHGVVYDRIPEEHKGKFEKTKGSGVQGVKGSRVKDENKDAVESVAVSKKPGEEDKS